MKQQTQVEKDQVRKRSTKYKTQRKLSRHSLSSSTTQHDYGPQSQQPDLSDENLQVLCKEYYDREVAVTKAQAEEIEKKTQGQAEVGLWFYHRRLRITASNFGRVAKRRETTPVAALVKSLLYTKNLETKEIRWGKTHEVDAKKAYIDYLKIQGDCDAEVTDSGFVVDIDEPCLGCSPDALVNIPSSSNPLGIAQFKCPYTAQSQTPAEAATNSKFSCSLNSSGELQLKKGHHYYYQVQGTLAITKRSWCDFVIWTPLGIMVDHIDASREFWEKIKPKLVEFYKKAVLPELAHSRFQSGQAIREPFLAAATSESAGPSEAEGPRKKKSKSSSKSRP